MIRLLLLFLFLPFAFSACKNSQDDIQRPDVSDIKVNVDIIRLEQELFSAKSKSEINVFLQENESFAENFLNADQFPHDSILVNQLYALVNNPSLDTVYRETQETFADMKRIEQEFETAFKYISYYYPEFKAPQIYTVVTGFSSDLYVSEEMIIIGLDYFLGPEATYRPVGIPNYILRRYTPNHIVPTCILLLSQRFNHSDQQDKSMLADMIYYGKSYFFTDFVLPTVPDSLIIGYTPEEMAGLEVNEHLVWTHFLQNELLYETSHIIKTKYLDERPATVEIGNKAPGRIGTWLGWQIVKEYKEKNEELSLPELMAETGARKILEGAKYRPEKKQ